jgi:hypothetical protein
MNIDFDYIKEYARQTGQKITDLLAMSPANDPFYAGTNRDVEMGQWFFGVWKKAGYTNSIVHLRRVHYWCVSREIKLPRPIKQNGEMSDIYQNSDNAWKYLTQASKMARYLGLVPIEQIADHKNPDPILNMAMLHLEEDKFSAERPFVQISSWGMERPYVAAHLPRYNDRAEFLCEVWVEKSTMNDVLQPVCEEYKANLVTFQGEASITAVYQLMAERAQLYGGRSVRIFYISDFDPAGRSMSQAVARKIEWMREYTDLYNVDIRLKQLALTPEQVETYNLPRTPIKESELRAGNFEDVHGAGAVELDALEAIHPGELADILRDSLNEYFDDELNRRLEEAVEDAENRARQAVDEIAKKYALHIQALSAMQAEVKQIKIDVTGYDFDPDLVEYWEDDDDWLYSSRRDYFAQLEFYRRHKDGE